VTDAIDYELIGLKTEPDVKKNNKTTSTGIKRAEIRANNPIVSSHHFDSFTKKHNSISTSSRKIFPSLTVEKVKLTGRYSPVNFSGIRD
jgi:hypothetical protein